MTSTATTPDAKPATRRTKNVALWIVQVLVAAQFAASGVLKVAGASSMVEMFAEIGAGQWLRNVVGVLEMAGALGLLLPRVRLPGALGLWVPRLRVLAAAGLVALMAGAAVTNVAVLGTNPLFPLVLLAASAVIVYGQRRGNR